MELSCFFIRRRQKALGPLTMDWSRIDDRQRQKALGPLALE